MSDPSRAWRAGTSPAGDLSMGALAQTPSAITVTSSTQFGVELGDAVDDRARGVGAPQSWILEVQLPARIRLEGPLGSSRATFVFCDGTQQVHVGPRLSRTNRTTNPIPSHQLLFAEALRPHLEIREDARERIGGRDALVFRAVPSSVVRPDPAVARWPVAMLLKPGASEYLLVLDAEDGVVLRCEARLGGRPFETTELLNLASTWMSTQMRSCLCQRTNPRSPSTCGDMKSLTWCRSSSRFRRGLPTSLTASTSLASGTHRAKGASQLP